MSVSELFSIAATMIGLTCIVYVIFKIKKDHEEEFKRLQQKIENQENRIFQLAFGRHLNDMYQEMIAERKAEMEKKQAAAMSDIGMKLNQGLENDLKNTLKCKKK